ncbi:hypothetical protein BJ944DRAFT_235431 [Cunninghamella echinulata]|nr:hypothetical protein BJ944DRAFT_235431 [Cunninghamella echinulata]
MAKSLCIPTSVLERIFDYISSQRYLAQYALVCKAWKVFAEKKLYDSIQFYSLHQFIQFLSLADSYYEQASFYPVKKVTFHFDILRTKGNIDSLTTTNYNKLSKSNQKTATSFADLMEKLSLYCPLIKSIHLLDKEKHMKHIRYSMEQQDNDGDSNDDVFTQFLSWRLLDYLPFWHKDQQWDVVTELVEEKTYIMDRAIFHAINQSCISLISLTLANVSISIPDTHSKFDPENYLGPNQSLSLPPLSTRPLGEANNNNTKKSFMDQESDDHRLYLPTLRTLYKIQLDQYKFYRPLYTITLAELSPFCPPNPSLKQLVLKNVNFLHPLKTVVYFITQYPHVTSLELINMDFTLDYGYTSEEERMEKRDDLRRAFFKLFVEFKKLTKFALTLHPAISRTCAQAIWPQYELLTWLSDHPTQLTSLTWPCDLFERNDEDEDYDHHPSYFHSILPWSTTYNVQNRLHLQSLLELDITLGPSCGEEVAIQVICDALLL